jgi:TonB family protein
MRFTRSTLVSACLVLCVANGGALVKGGALAAQSLGGLAQQEAARRKAILQPARVITEDDLRPVAGPAPSGAQALAAVADADAAPAERESRVAVAPARLKGGALPQIPIMAVSGGEVVLEVAVNRAGRVTGVTPLRHTAPFSDAMAAAVRSWTFAPAEDAAAPPAGAAIDPATRKPMDSTVLVVGVFRPPALFPVTLGEPPANVAPSSGRAPALAGPIEMPAYPPAALHDGVVLVELDVAAHGGVEGIGVVRSATGFDQSALAAVSALAFRPARVHDRAAPAFVYVAVAFRQPIT